MHVVTSCHGRFHIFDQAKQLHRFGLLNRLVTNYPKLITRHWGIPDEKVTSLLTHGVSASLVQRAARWLRPSTRMRLARYIHEGFGSLLARYLPAECDVLVGLSSFSLEALEQARGRGMKTVVDHGSLHQQEERRRLIEERALWGLPQTTELPPQWLIERENEEFRLADRVFVLSQVAKHTLVGEGIAAQKIRVIPCGVDLEDFRPGRKSDDVFRIVQCGAISERKGVQYTLKAFRELNLRRAELWFVGGGLERTALRPIIDRYRSECVHFVGSQPRHRLSDFYAQASVVVLPSIADGFGLVIPQAMACARPVIVTDAVGASEIVADGTNGFVIPVRDTEAFKRRLLFLYEHRDACLSMGQRALNAISANHSWDHYGDRLVRELYALRG